MNEDVLTDGEPRQIRDRDCSHRRVAVDLEGNQPDQLFVGIAGSILDRD